MPFYSVVLHLINVFLSVLFSFLPFIWYFQADLFWFRPFQVYFHSILFRLEKCKDLIFPSPTMLCHNVSFHVIYLDSYCILIYLSSIILFLYVIYPFLNNLSWLLFSADVASGDNFLTCNITQFYLQATTLLIRCTMKYCYVITTAVWILFCYLYIRGAHTFSER